jgi:hypothetical protein
LLLVSQIYAVSSLPEVHASSLDLKTAGGVVGIRVTWNLDLVAMGVHRYGLGMVVNVHAQWQLSGERKMIAQKLYIVVDRGNRALFLQRHLRGCC